MQKENKTDCTKREQNGLHKKRTKRIAQKENKPDCTKLTPIFGILIKNVYSA